MEDLIIRYYPYVILILVWTIPWKGIALWKSARRGHLVWFLIIFLFNTLALLEITYLFLHRRRKEDDSNDYVLDESNQIRPEGREKRQRHKSRRIV